MTDPAIHLTSEMARARAILLDTRACPVCAGPIGTTTCGTCGIDLSGDAGLRIWRSSLEAVAAIEARAALAAEVRGEQLAARPRYSSPAAGSPAVPPPVAPAPLAMSVPVPRPAPAPRPVAEPRAPWRVQTVLQILGVALLAMASLVFLVFSWDVLTVAQRGGVIALGTVVVLVLAAWLKRRDLEGSAQAVGVLGSVLVVLDAWAVHAIGIFPKADPAAYAAVACVVCAAALGAYGRQTGVRAGTVTASLLLPAAPLMLLGHGGSAAGVAALLLGVSVVGTLRFLLPWGMRGERAVLAGAAAVGLVAAWATALVGVVVEWDGGEVWPPVTVLAAATVVALAQGALAAREARAAGRRAGAGRVWAYGAGVLAITTATAVSVVLGLAAAVIPAAIAVALVATTSRWPATRPGRGLVRACADSAGLTALAVGVPAAVLLYGDGIDAITGVDGAPTSEVLRRLSGVVAVAVLLVAIAVWRGAGRAARAARHAAAAVTVEIVLVGAAVAGGDEATAALLAVGVVGAVVGLLRTGWLRWYLRVGTLLSLGAAFVAAQLTTGGGAWWSGSVLAAGAAVAYTARWWGGAPVARAVSTGTTALVGLAALAQLLAAGDVAAPVTVAASVTVAILTLVALRVARSTAERHVSLGAAALVGLGCWMTGVSPVPAVVAPSIVLGAVVAVSVLAVALVGGSRLVAPVVVWATAAVAPVAMLELVTAQALTGWPDAVAVCFAAVVLGGAAALVAGTLPASLADRRLPLEGVGWVVVGTGIAASFGQSVSAAALSLVLASLVAAACASRRDRRAELWAALGLLVAASWCALAIRDVGVPEAYLAPLGAVLAAVGVVRWRSGGRSAAELLGCGLALATVPTAVIVDPITIGRATLDRTMLATVAAAVLVLTALLLVRRRSAPYTAGNDPVLCVAAVGALLAVLGPARRAVVLAGLSWTEPQPPTELWALPAAALLAGAGAAWLLARPGQDAGLRRVVPWGVLLVATIPALLTQDDGPAGLARIAVGAALGTYLAARGAAGLGALPGARWSPPAPDLVGMGASLLVVTTVAALARTWAVPQDAVLVVLGVLVLVVGAVRMRTEPTTPTWSALGPGLALALGVPTLTALATGTGWRIGVAIAGGLLAVVVGAVRRWQAPFVVGALALLLELVVQLAPVARQAVGGLGWWPVLALGGAALLGLGLTYERRLRDAREAARYVAQMS